jgi:hypothetical protein
MASPQDGGDAKGPTPDVGSGACLEGSFYLSGANFRRLTPPGKQLLRKNVTFKKKDHFGTKEGGSKKFSLKDMISNAKKITEEFVEPIKKQFRDEGIIPNPFQDVIEEGIENKYLSFPRQLDGKFNDSFGEEYHQFRQHAYKRAVKKYQATYWRPTYKFLQGVNMAPGEDMVLRGKALRTGIRESMEIDLLPACINSVSYNTWEASLVWSKLAPGNVTKHEEWLSYNTRLKLKEVAAYGDELEELQYIYQSFWYLARINRRNWLGALYEQPESRVLDYFLPPWQHPNGMKYPDDMVLISVEGTDIMTTAEEILKWTELYRLPKKRYPIGGCEDHHCVAYAIYLTRIGIPEKYIIMHLTLDSMKEVKNRLEIQIFGDLAENALEPEEVPEGISLEDFRDLLDKKNQEEPKTLQAGVMPAWEDMIKGLEDESEDEDSSGDEKSQREEGHGEEMNLPYDWNLHDSANEFAAYVEGDTREEYSPGAQADDAVSYTSETMPDRELTPLEALGIDLIDPSSKADKTSQPALNRVRLVWNPGGGVRPIPKRYNIVSLERLRMSREGLLRQARRGKW